MAHGRPGTQSLKALWEYINESGLRTVVTADSTACAMASIPVDAVTRGGCESVKTGSRMAMRAAAFVSRQAIFWCVCSSAIKVADWHSLPVPAVVGIAMSGSIGAFALPTPQ